VTSFTDERDLLAAARRGLSPTAADRARVLRAISGVIAAGDAGSNGDVPPGGAPRLITRARRLVAMGAVAVAAAGVGYLGGFRAGRRQAAFDASLSTAASSSAERPKLVTRSPAAERAGIGHLPAAPSRDVADAPALPPAVRRRAHAAPVPPPTLDETPSSSLTVELEGLRAVERALRDGKPGFALSLLRELDDKVPKGRLLEERLATRTIARCAAGDVPMGIDLAEEFADRYPDSVYGRRVADACPRTDSRRSGD